MIITGLTTSILHVLSGPDHLAAVTTIAADKKNKSWFVGLIWGLGHNLGVLIIGLLFWLFRNYIPVETISKYSEVVVGFVLIYIGIVAIIKINKKKIDKDKEVSKKKGMFIIMLIGLIHGFAGISHIIGLLPTLALPTNTAVFLYIFGFMIGTITAMIFYSQLIGIISNKFEKSNKKSKLLTFKSLLIIFTLGVGIFWITKSII